MMRGAAGETERGNRQNRGEDKVLDHRFCLVVVWSVSRSWLNPTRPGKRRVGELTLNAVWKIRFDRERRNGPCDPPSASPNPLPRGARGEEEPLVAEREILGSIKTSTGRTHRMEGPQCASAGHTTGGKEERSDQQDAMPPEDRGGGRRTRVYGCPYGARSLDRPRLHQSNLSRHGGLFFFHHRASGRQGRRRGRRHRGLGGARRLAALAAPTGNRLLDEMRRDTGDGLHPDHQQPNECRHYRTHG